MFMVVYTKYVASSTRACSCMYLADRTALKNVRCHTGQKITIPLPIHPPRGLILLYIPSKTLESARAPWATTLFAWRDRTGWMGGQTDGTDDDEPR